MNRLVAFSANQLKCVAMVGRRITGLLAVAIFATSVLAGDDHAAVVGLEPEKVRSLAERGRALEYQIGSRQSKAKHRKDAAAQQYHVGYSDGYNKAILDLLKSQLLSGAPLLPSTTTQSISREERPEIANSVAPALIEMPATFPTTKTVVIPDLVPMPTVTLSSPIKEINPPQQQDITKKVSASQVGKYQHLILQSTKHLEDKNWSQAVSFASAAIAVNPKDGTPYINRSWGYAEQGLFNEALKDANAAVSKGNNNPLAYNNRAYTYELMNDIASAKKDYQRACNLKFQSACGIVDKINILTAGNKEKITDLMEQSEENLKQRNWPVVETLSNQILSMDINNVPALLNRSWSYAEQGKLNSALTDANKSIKIAPNNALTYNNRAYTYELLDDLSKAKKDYQKACSLQYKNACAVVAKINALNKNKTKNNAIKIASLIEQSLQKFRDKDWHSVELLSNQVIRLDPKNAIAYVNRAGARTEMGLFHAAVKDSDQALLINPSMGVAYNNKGYALEKMGQYLKASQQYQKACNLGIQQSCQDYRRLSVSVSKAN